MSTASPPVSPALFSLPLHHVASPVSACVGAVCLVHVQTFSPGSQCGEESGPGFRSHAGLVPLCPLESSVAVVFHPVSGAFPAASRKTSHSCVITASSLTSLWFADTYVCLRACTSTRHGSYAVQGSRLLLHTLRTAVHSRPRLSLTGQGCSQLHCFMQSCFPVTIFTACVVDVLGPRCVCVIGCFSLLSVLPVTHAHGAVCGVGRKGWPGAFTEGRRGLCHRYLSTEGLCPGGQGGALEMPGSSRRAFQVSISPVSRVCTVVLCPRVISKKC